MSAPNVHQYLDYKNVLIREVLDEAGNPALIFIYVFEAETKQMYRIVVAESDFEPEFNFKKTMRPLLHFNSKTNQLVFGGDEETQSLNLFSFNGILI